MEKIRKAILDRFGDRVAFTFEMDKRATGNLEVTIVGTDVVLHAKNGRGDGYFDTEAKVEKVLAGLDAYLKQ